VPSIRYNREKERKIEKVLRPVTMALSRALGHDTTAGILEKDKGKGSRSPRVAQAGGK